MSVSATRPTSLARRFALAAGGLAAGALLAISLVTWWLVEHQRVASVEQLARSERTFRAQAVGSDLAALAARMNEIAGSTILATGLVDSIGRETYVVPYLNGIRQINGMPVQVLFTDFQGQEIASNGPTHFDAAQRLWLQQALQQGHAAATLFPTGDGSTELVAMEPMVYTRTTSPEGAVLYKIALRDLHLGRELQLVWGPAREAEGANVTTVPVPPVYAALGLRLRGEPGARAMRPVLAPEYLTILMMAGALFVAVLLGGTQLARRLTRDLEALERFSGRVGGSGLDTERAPVGGSSEVAGLARSINRMLDRLHEQRGALLHEQERLAELAQALQLADRRKDEFLAMLAHELRNPLSPITTAAELLRRRAGENEQLRQPAEIIARQARHLTGIVADLLDVSRVTRGQVRLTLAWVDLREVVDSAIEQVRAQIDAAGHRLEVHKPLAEAGVRGDRSRLVQVVANLLANAARYTPPGGRLSVQLTREGAEQVLVVQDNGRGIEAALLPSVFELFTQGPRPADRGEGGLGLGLALVRQLVLLHQGSVQALSDGPGRGATFTVRLPAIDAPTVAAPSTTPGARSDTLPVPPRRILLVDDNVDAAENLAALLQLQGHSVTVRHDGPAALQCALTTPFDVAILDIGLPGMDGHALARALRAQGAHAVLVALTGYGQPADVARSSAAGFEHHLVKPVDLQALDRVLADRPRHTDAASA